MSGDFDAEFWVSIGDYSQMPELSDYKLADLFRQGRADIRKANSDRRLKQATRDSTLQSANRLIEACEAEFVRRTDAKAFSLSLAKIGRKGNVIQFPRGKHETTA